MFFFTLFGEDYGTQEEMYILAKATRFLRYAQNDRGTQLTSQQRFH